MTKMPNAAEPLLTIKQVAEQLNVSVKTVRRRIKTGLLAVIRDGGIVRVRQRDLQSYVALHRHDGP